MTRDQAVKIVVPLSGAFAIGSLAFAVFVRFCQPALLKPYGYIILGLWALVPPLWFIYEWMLSASLAPAEQDRIKHFHDLARNLWLALILALGAIMGAENPFK
jgi:hypothetical protein